ncbi:LuxR C-terminal-related transcriptional regulator [Streptomyces sp. NPDC059740]|uniref:LuxR C-terminal-related transcriptional regulator n=1 Tax=Streptomyces sp. NPDC059740 TaxID=3346926 RepID=UPI0036596E0C
MTEREQQVRALLTEGLTNTEIAARLHMRRATVREIRTATGVPPRPGLWPFATLNDALAAHTRDAGGGHLQWTGSTNTHGVPIVHFAGRPTSAYRAAFEVHYGRAPHGQVRSLCDVPRCVAGRCLEDQTQRSLTRAQLAAMTGRDTSLEWCRQGLHRLAETTEWMPNGQRRCGACRRAADTARKERV